MDEADARRVLLLRAFEDPLAAPWSEADRDTIDRETARALGADTTLDRQLAHRAALGLQRLLPRVPTAAAALAAGSWPGWLGPVTLLLAFVAGLGLDSLGPAQRINLFALPLLAMLAWNLAVYGLLGAHALQPEARGATAPLALLQALRSWPARRPRAWPAPLLRHATDWARTSRPLQVARLTTLLHSAAALLALGAVVSMYARGSVFEYRAGWESTFFDAPAMHRLIGALLGPAAWLSGITLPDEPGFAALRFSAGGGEIAARWIHLYALTIAGVVVLPRALLAAVAAGRARRLARDLPLPLHEPYFQRLRPRPHGEPVAVSVLPYSYRLPPERIDTLRAALSAECAAELGREPALQLSDGVPLGGEDDADRWWPAEGAPALLVALFPLGATPERETHGAFVQALAARMPADSRLLLLVDEAGFRERFGDTRLAERRDAWRRLLRELGHEPRFADLGEAPAPA